MQGSLGSAQGWGVWDILGGGLIATAVKHSRIDDARQHVHSAQQALHWFIRKLKYVNPHLQTDITIDIGGFATFADYFFDGLIVDWIVQSLPSKAVPAADQGGAFPPLDQKAGRD